MSFVSFLFAIFIWSRDPGGILVFHRVPNRMLYEWYMRVTHLWHTLKYLMYTGRSLFTSVLEKKISIIVHYEVLSSFMFIVYVCVPRLTMFYFTIENEEIEKSARVVCS